MDIEFRESIFGEYEIVNRLDMDGFRKFRAAFKNATVDVSVIDTEEPEEFIENRKEELNHVSMDVPHPYKAEIEKKDGEKQNVEFDEENGREYGLGHADTEYNLVLGNNEDPRYIYFISWEKLPEENRLVEIEIYRPVSDFKREESFELLESLRLDS